MPDRVTLDWRQGHVGRIALCVHCRKPTNLRDDNDRPSHKTCAEKVTKRGAMAPRSERFKI